MLDSGASIRCPICRREVALDNRFMPFCSDRCRIIDLGNWATEKYVIPEASKRNDSEEDTSEREGEDF